MSDIAGQRVILITGCSSGFGALCAREFAHAGDQVVATMRNPAQQTFATDVAIDVRTLDVTDAESIRHCVEGVQRD